MPLYHVRVIDGRDNTKQLSITFDHPAESIDTLAALLAERQIVSGEQLFVVDDKRGGKLVQRRKPLAIGLRAVTMIGPYEHRVLESAE